MTLQQVCERYGYSESSFKRNFNRTAAAIQKKYGITLVKVKKGKQTEYQILDHRANSIFEEDNKKAYLIGKNTLNFANSQFYVFFGIVMTPQGVFRGTRQDYLKYLRMPVNKKNILVLNQALTALQKKDRITFEEDEDYIIIYIKRHVEKELQFKINLIQDCARIAEENNKRGDKYIQLIKIWLALVVCEENQPFTNKDLALITGLSQHQVKEGWKLLKKANVFNSSRQVEKVDEGVYICSGKNIDLNAFCNNW